MFIKSKSETFKFKLTSLTCVVDPNVNYLLNQIFFTKLFFEIKLNFQLQKLFKI